jgi:hypothetical protein
MAGHEGGPDFDFEEEFGLDNLPPIEFDDPVPDKCRDCAVQCELRSAMFLSLEEKQTLEAVGKLLMGQDQEDDTFGFGGFVNEQMRKVASFRLELLDTRIEDIKEEIAACSDNCEGTLIMQESRDDTIYTAAVCGSEIVLKDTGNYAPDLDYVASLDPNQDVHKPAHTAVHVWKEDIPGPDQFK